MSQQKVFISIGSNIRRNYHFKMALDALFDRFGQMKLSSVYQSAAVGFSGDDFYNMVVGFSTNQSIVDLVGCFKSIEKMSGRDYSAPKFSDRTLDIDLLNYGQLVCREPIVLPRAEITYHAFVLQPLNDIAPDWTHPVNNISIGSMWERFDKSKQRLNAIDDPFDLSKYRT